MSKPETAASPHSPKSWAELLDQKGACFLEADSTEKRQEAAALLLNAVSSMLRHGGLGSPTPEAGKAISHIFTAFSKLLEGDRAELLKVRCRLGNPGDPPARKRLKSFAAAWVEALARIGEQRKTAISIVTEALNTVGVQGYKGPEISKDSVKGWKLDELVETYLPDIKSFLAFRTSGWRPNLAENERSKLLNISDDDSELFEFMHLTRDFSSNDHRFREDLLKIVVESLESFGFNKKINA